MNNSLDSIFPDLQFSTTELIEIANVMNSPLIRKYLTSCAAIALKDIGQGLPKENETAEAYLLKQAQVVGSLNTFRMLLSIEKSTFSKES